MENIREILARNMKINRRKSGLTQATLAEKANITTQYIAMIEVCKKFPTPEMLERIAKALEIETVQLFSADPVLEAALHQFYQTIANDIEQVVTKAIQKAFTDNCKCNCHAVIRGRQPDVGSEGRVAAGTAAGSDSTSLV